MGKRTSTFTTSPQQSLSNRHISLCVTNRKRIITMKQYYLLRNILLGTAASATLTASPTVAAPLSMEESSTSGVSSSLVVSPIHASSLLRKPNSANPEASATTRTTTNTAAYDRAIRYLEDSQHQDALDHCSGHTTAMITCLLTQCVGQEPCEQQDEPATSPSGMLLS